MNAIVIKNCYGHEFCAALVAAAYHVPVLVCPKKDNEEEYNNEAQKIACFMRYATDLKIVPYKERNSIKARDFVQELVSGKVEGTEWETIFSTKLEPSLQYDEPRFWWASPSTMIVPGKLMTDGLCGLSAQNQSISPSVFDFFNKTDWKLVLGQHFSKDDDMENIALLKEMFPMMKVPGFETEEEREVLGLRGVEHRKLHHLYDRLSACVGIPGTHTWILLALFPKVRQVIIYNRKGVEHWEAIARAARRSGRRVAVVGYDETTDMQALKERVVNACIDTGIVSMSVL